MPTQLGPFVLDQILGRGGMGTVWSATVQGGGARVAVKTLTAKAAREPANIRDLNAEVRAMATMTHNRIALVLDCGITPDLGSEDLPAGTPWLAMELASGGSLASNRPADWPGIREVLQAVLSGLSHAHARGLIHRDIKPGNVLQCTGADLRPGWKVADFGIVRAMGSEGDKNIRGTPAYMAPEQFRGRWRDQGPWTDLYAVGCLAWELATGNTPFRGSWQTLRNAHLQSDLPAWLPKIAVPPGFENWCREMLEKPGSLRVPRAADAIRSLSALGEVDAVQTDTWTSPLTTSETWSTATLDDPTGDWAIPEITRESPEEVKQLPFDWRPVGAPTPTIHLRGVGLGLFMLRTSRMVGRDVERDGLWQRLFEVVRERRAQAVVLHGATGVGKSRLAQWLVHRAHEVGCTELPLVLRANAAFDDDAGIATMMRQALQALGADEKTLARRLRRRLIRVGEADDQNFQRCLRALGKDAPGVAASEHRTALAWLVGVLARNRPVIVWLDDVQWSASALRFMTAILDGQTRDPSPVLLMATVREEALASRPATAHRLSQLEKRDSVSRQDIAPMATRDLIHLLRDTLGVDGALAERVSVRADGSPLYATQLVGGWAQRGMLQRGPGGFTLSADHDFTLPLDVAEVWTKRLDGIQRRWSDDWRAAAELSALFGGEIDRETWQMAASILGLVDANEALDAMLSDGLLWPVEASGSRLVFVHGVIREVLVQASQQSGRIQGLHSAIADVLALRGGSELQDRLGRHLLGAGRYTEALDPLWQASERRRLRGQFGLADRLLVDRERALTLAGVPPEDEAWTRIWRSRAEYTRMNGDSDAAIRLANKAEAAAMQPGRETLRGTAIRVRAIAKHRLGRREEAVTDIELALSLALIGGDAFLISQCHTSFAYVLPTLGRREEGEQHARESLAILATLEDVGTAFGNVWTAMSSLLLHRGDLDGAEHASDAALAAYEEAGNRSGIAMVANDRGDLLRRRGRRDAAEESYLLSIRTYRAVGAMQQHIAELNLGIVMLEQGRFAAAHPHLQRSSREFRAHGWGYAEAACEVGLAACGIAGGDGDLWDAHIGRAADLWANGGLDFDFAGVSEIAAQVAEQRDPARAKAAWKLAADQWQGLGLLEQARAARRRA